MEDLGTLLRFLHVLGAAGWIGGMIVLGAVAVPAARSSGDPDAGRRVLRAATRRFGAVAGAAWVLILASGFALLAEDDIAMAELPDSDYGRRLVAKIALLAGLGVVAGLHALWQGPRVRRADEAGDEATARRWRAVGGALDSVLLLGSLAALWLAVSLV